MTVQEALERLATYEKSAFALNHAAGILYYDGATVAPKDSAAVRAKTLGEISRMSYTLSTSSETMELLQTLQDARKELDPVTARKVSEMMREMEYTRRIPEDEYVAWQELCVTADAVWHDAKSNNDFASFCPYLQKLFDTARRVALYMEPTKDPYETLLSRYERGLTIETCDRFFAALREKLVPLIRRVVEKSANVNDAPLQQAFPIDIQRRFSEFVMDVMGIDKNRCIIGETEHPFTTSFSKRDVRITTHYHKSMLASSLYSVVHEGGHALYELHIGDELDCTALGGGVSMGIHESQSRFYENVIGRSRAFCSVIYPWLKKEFAPRLDNVSEDEFFRMINKAEPSLIRTEADELTYCLHIMVRYELEKKMLAGEMTAEELPDAWNRMYKEYLGVDVPDDRQGVLQDSHWSNCNIGYFPSYAIGSAYGPQFLHEMKKDLDVDAVIRSGNLSPINAWFEERIWKHGCMQDPVKLFESVCGKFDPNYYTNYLEAKFTDVYGL